MNRTLHDLREALRTLVRSPGYSLDHHRRARPRHRRDERHLQLRRRRAAATAALRQPRSHHADLGTAAGLSRRPKRRFDRQLSRLATTGRRVRGHGGVHQFRGHDVRRKRAAADKGDARLRGLLRRLRTKAALGRTFAPDEDQLGKENVAVITHRLWQSTFGSAPDIVGRAVVLDRRTFTIIGVLPAGSPFDRGWADLFRPLAFRPDDQTSQLPLAGRRGPAARRA